MWIRPTDLVRLSSFRHWGDLLTFYLRGLGGGGRRRATALSSLCALFSNWAVPWRRGAGLLPHFVFDIQSLCSWNKALYFPIGYPHESRQSPVTNPGLLFGDQRRKQRWKKSGMERNKMRKGTKSKTYLNNWSENKAEYWRVIRQCDQSFGGLKRHTDAREE